MSLKEVDSLLSSRVAGFPRIVVWWRKEAVKSERDLGSVTYCTMVIGLELSQSWSLHFLVC